MRRPPFARALLASLLLAAPMAHADDAADPAPPRNLPALVLDSGRKPVPAVDPDAFRLVVPGELQLRLQAQRTFPMVATASAMDARPGLLENSHGQSWFGSHWLRVTPRFLVRDTVELVAQMDVLTGTNMGELAQGTRADATPRDDYNGFSNVQGRWLYAQIRLPFGLLRMGQQPNHWGMGVLTNDGDHPTLFGDYRYGAISERILFATRPLGQGSDFVLAVAGDLVYRDSYARLTRGQQAFQGVLSAFYERGPHKLGVFSTLRHQRNDERSVAQLFGYTDTIDALAVDLHGKTAVRVPGDDAFLFAEAEAATIVGSTTLFRSVDRGTTERTSIRSYGGAAILGYVHRSYDMDAVTSSPQAGGKGPDAATLGGPSATRGIPYGDLVVQLEVGHASGDADPNDGTQKRFSFDPNHRIGLLLFDEVLRWHTARSATAATDPLLSNATRPAPGIEYLPSNGSVFGAQYVNPTFVVRPQRHLDLKGGMVLAQTTADMVDPYRLATTGNYQNYRGGSPKRRDLGLELDAGFEVRIPLDYAMTAQLGAQAGILFPGGALANAAGERLPPQWLAVARLGLQF